MNKLISTFLLITLSLNAFAAPMGVSGQNQTNKYPSVIKTPNNQATDIGSSSSLLETGNKNRLVNPGFEHSTFSTGWTTAVTSTATITPAVETTSPLEGKKSGKYTCAGGASGGTCTISQDVTTAHTPQGAAALYVKSDTAWSPSTSTGVQVYSRKDGANFQAKAVDVTSDKLFSIPVTLSNVTSTGVAAVITVAASQTIIVFLDEGYVGAADLKQDFSPTGPMISYGAMTIKGTTTDPTKATTREKDDVSCRVNGQFYECEYVYRASSATGSAVGSGAYYYVLPSGIAMDSSVPLSTNNTGTFSYGGTHAVGSIGWGDMEYSGNGDTGTKCDLYATSTTTFQAACNFSGSVLTPSNTNASINNADYSFKWNVRFRGAGLSSNYSAYSTTNANTSFAPCTPTGSQGFGTATFDLQCKRVGESLIVMGKVTAVTSTAVEGQVNLPLWNGAQLASKGTSVIPSIRKVGEATLSAVGDQAPTILIEPSKSYMTFGFQGASGAGLTKVTGSGWLGTGTVTFSINATIPIEGWDESNIIIGQFNGLESCANSAQCETTYYADISATAAVSGQEITFISGCTLSTNTFTCTYSTPFAQTPMCEITPGAGATQAQKTAESASSISYIIYNATGSPTNVAHSISCRKRGSDYVAKSARAVASDQNVATPGVTKVKACYYSFAGASGTVASPTECTTGTCVEVEDTCNAIAAPPRTSIGTYTVTISSGTFAPNALLNVDAKAYSTSAQIRECYNYNNSAQTWAANSSGGATLTLGCIGATGTSSDAFARLRIEGQAP